LITKAAKKRQQKTASTRIKQHLKLCWTWYKRAEKCRKNGVCFVKLPHHLLVLWKVKSWIL